MDMDNACWRSFLRLGLGFGLLLVPDPRDDGDDDDEDDDGCFLASPAAAALGSLAGPLYLPSLQHGFPLGERLWAALWAATLL